MNTVSPQGNTRVVFYIGDGEERSYLGQQPPPKNNVPMQRQNTNHHVPAQPQPNANHDVASLTTVYGNYLVDFVLGTLNDMF